MTTTIQLTDSQREAITHALGPATRRSGEAVVERAISILESTLIDIEQDPSEARYARQLTAYLADLRKVNNNEL